MQIRDCTKIQMYKRNPFETEQMKILSLLFKKIFVQIHIKAGMGDESIEQKEKFSKVK